MFARNAASATVAAFAALMSLPADSQARIVCEGQFQVGYGGAVATPACADHYLAQVARGYGMRVSAEGIRNPGTKRRVCEFVGYDSRVQNICSGWRNEGSGGHAR